MSLDGHFILTHSRISCWRSCQRKHFFRYLLGIRRIKKAKALRIGSVIHKALHLRRRGKSLDSVLAWIHLNYEDHRRAASDADEVDFFTFEEELCLAMIEYYDWRWRYSAMEVIASERTFEMPVTNPATGYESTLFRFAGVVDGVVNYGRTALLETKTTGDDLAKGEGLERLMLDAQVSSCTLGALSLGLEVKTTVYDLLRKPQQSRLLATPVEKRIFNKGSGQLRKGQRETDETAEQYANRIRADIEASYERYYRRHEVPRMSNTLENFRWELWGTQKQMRLCENRGWHPMNTSNCTQYGRCEYFGVCCSGIDLRTDLPEGFEQVADIHPELTKDQDDAETESTTEGRVAPEAGDVAQPDGSNADAPEAGVETDEGLLDQPRTG